jgi:hypothetical protein
MALLIYVEMPDEASKFILTAIRQFRWLARKIADEQHGLYQRVSSEHEQRDPVGKSPSPSEQPP